MDNDQPYYQNYSSYEYVSRKHKNKKKTKLRNNKFELKINNEDSDVSNALESAGDSNLTDYNISDGELDRKTGNPSIADDTFVNNTNGVSVDGTLKAPPELPNSEGDADRNEELTITIVNEANQLPFEVNEETRVFQRPKEEFVNHRALSKNATTYNLEKFEKKVLLIFNQERIEGYERRLGTEKDVEALTRTFESFDFKVTEHKDWTKDQIFKELKTFNEQQFADYGCVAVAVLTHGSSNGLLRAKDQLYSEIDVINHFNRPTLFTKPKILIIQACRGTNSSHGAPVFQTRKIRKDYNEDLEPYFLPPEADMLILHSSYHGTPSYRDELDGSWFIQTLCSKIDELAPNHDLQTIMTEVQRDVAV